MVFKDRLDETRHGVFPEVSGDVAKLQHPFGRGGVAVDRGREAVCGAEGDMFGKNRFFQDLRRVEQGEQQAA